MGTMKRRDICKEKNCLFAHSEAELRSTDLCFKKSSRTPKELPKGWKGFIYKRFSVRVRLVGRKMMPVTFQPLQRSTEALHVAPEGEGNDGLCKH